MADKGFNQLLLYGERRSVTAAFWKRHFVARAVRAQTLQLENGGVVVAREPDGDTFLHQFTACSDTATVLPVRKMEPFPAIDFPDRIPRDRIEPAKFQRFRMFTEVLQTKREHDGSIPLRPPRLRLKPPETFAPRIIS